MATVAAYEIARRQNQRLAESGLQQGLRARIGDCCMVWWSRTIRLMRRQCLQLIECWCFHAWQEWLRLSNSPVLLL